VRRRTRERVRHFPRERAALLTCPSKSVKLLATRVKLRSSLLPPCRFFLAHFLLLVVASFFLQHPAGRIRSKIACARYAPKSTSDNAAAAYGSCFSRLCAYIYIYIHVCMDAFSDENLCMLSERRYKFCSRILEDARSKLK